jgi:hypothetical protein
MGILNPEPEIRMEADRLEIGTSFWYGMMHLFACSRKVSFDRVNRTVDIRSRSLWVETRSRRIALDEIRYIATNYETWPKQALIQAEDGRHQIILGLRESGEEVLLFSVDDPWTRPQYRLTNKELVGGNDRNGDLYRHVLKLVQDWTGAPLGTPDAQPADAAEAGRKCAQCNHLVAPTVAKCPYCGAGLN